MMKKHNNMFENFVVAFAVISFFILQFVGVYFTSIVLKLGYGIGFIIQIAIAYFYIKYEEIHKREIIEQYKVERKQYIERYGTDPVE